MKCRPVSWCSVLNTSKTVEWTAIKTKHVAFKHCWLSLFKTRILLSKRDKWADVEVRSLIWLDVLEEIQGSFVFQFSGGVFQLFSHILPLSFPSWPLNSIVYISPSSSIIWIFMTANFLQSSCSLPQRSCMMLLRCVMSADLMQVWSTSDLTGRTSPLLSDSFKRTAPQAWGSK